MHWRSSGFHITSCCKCHGSYFITPDFDAQTWTKAYTWTLQWKPYLYQESVNLIVNSRAHKKPYHRRLRGATRLAGGLGVSVSFRNSVARFRLFSRDKMNSEDTTSTQEKLHGRNLSFRPVLYMSQSIANVVSIAQSRQCAPRYLCWTAGFPSAFRYPFDHDFSVQPKIC